MKPTINLTGNLVKGLLVVFLMASCTNLEKAIDKGDYDTAISVAVKKLRGKTKKKQKYVAALEEGFLRANKRDMANINRLRAKDDATAWEKVHFIAGKIERRQHLIEPLLPVIDREGYKANFTFVKTDRILNESEDRVAALLYDEANELLVMAYKGDKEAAREAYDAFSVVEKYKRNYKDSRELQAEARDLGIIHIGYKVLNNSQALLPNHLTTELEQFGAGQMNTFWKKYHINPSASVQTDYQLKMIIDHVEVGPSLVREREFVEKKEIKDGWRYVLDADGNVLKDSLGNDVKEPNFKIVKAKVLEVNLSKEVRMDARMVLKDMLSHQVIGTERLGGTTVFEHCGTTFRGDRRALSPKTLQHLNDDIVVFPDDSDMLQDVVYQIRPQIKGKINQMRLI